MKFFFLGMSSLAFFLFGGFLPSPSTISIDYQPIGRICTEAYDQCDLTIQYSFTVNAEDTAGLVVGYRFIGPQGIPLSDPYGTLVGEYPNYAIAGTYPLGAISFLVEATNAAEEAMGVELPLEVVDCYSPIMTWVDTIRMPARPIDLDQNNRYDFIGLKLKPTDFSTTPPFEGCNGMPQFSITHPDSLPGPVDSLIIACWDTFPQIIRLWTWDGADNPSAVQPDSTVGGPNYTKRDVVIMAPTEGTDCDSLPIVTGKVMTETGKVYPDLTVHATGDIALNATTDKAGGYLLTEFNPGVSYRFTVDTIRDRPANGVTILDVTLLARHILNMSPLTSPYKMIAADVNDSGTLTTLDIVLMRLMIIGQLDEFPGGTPSWRFIPSHYSFPPERNPFDPRFREDRILNNIQGFHEVDFVAIKMGDINCSATLP